MRNASQPRPIPAAQHVAAISDLVPTAVFDLNPRCTRTLRDEVHLHVSFFGPAIGRGCPPVAEQCRRIPRRHFAPAKFSAIRCALEDSTRHLAGTTTRPGSAVTVWSRGHHASMPEGPHGERVIDRTRDVETDAQWLAHGRGRPCGWCSGKAETGSRLDHPKCLRA